MKKKLLLALGAVSMFAACEKTPVNVTPEGDNAVSFRTEIAASSRVADNHFESGDNIFVAAYGENDYNEMASYTFDGTRFTSENPIVKEDEAQELSYISVYPARNTDYTADFKFEVETDQTTEENYTESDLLVASIDATSDMQPTLQFQHKLSNLLFTFKLKDGAAATVSEIFVSAKTTVNCDITGDEFTAEGDAEFIEVATASNGGGKVILAPQSFSVEDDFVSFLYDGEVYEAQFSKDVELLSGWRYTYEFTIDAETKMVTIEQINATVNDWEDDKLIAEPLTATLASADFSNIKLNVDKGDYEGLYYVGLAINHQYTGDPTSFIEGMIAKEKLWYSTDFSVPDEKIIFFKGGVISLNNAWTINPSSTYSIAVAGVNDDGSLATDVVYLEVETPGGEITGSIDFTIDEIGAENVLATATPSPEVANYLYGAVTTATFNKSFFGDPMLVANTVINKIKGIGCDLAVADGVDVLTGTYQFDFTTRWSIKPETDYTLIVFGVDAQGLVTTNIAQHTATTIAAEPLRYTDDMSLEVKSFNECDIIVDVDKGTFNGNYFVGLSSKVYLTAEEVAADLMDEQLNFFQNDMGFVDNFLVFDNNATVSMNRAWNVYPETYYMVVAFGIDDDGNIYTNIANEVVQTEALVIEGSFDLELTSTSAANIVVKCSPSAEVGNYMCGAIPTADLNSTELFNGDAAAAAQYMTDQLYYGGAQMTTPNDLYLFSGEKSVNIGDFWVVNPNTEYTVMVFGINAAPTVNTEVYTLTAVTPASNAPQRMVEKMELVYNPTEIKALNSKSCLKESVITERTVNRYELDYNFSRE